MMVLMNSKVRMVTQESAHNQTIAQVTIGEYDFQDKSKTGEVQRFHATEVLLLHLDLASKCQL